MRQFLVAGLFVSTVGLGLAQQVQKPAAPAAPRPAILTPASAEGFDRTVKPFLAANCVPCHGNEKHKNDLNFEAMTSVDTLIEDYRKRRDPGMTFAAEVLIK